MRQKIRQKSHTFYIGFIISKRKLIPFAEGAKLATIITFIIAKHYQNTPPKKLFYNHSICTDKCTGNVCFFPFPSAIVSSYLMHLSEQIHVYMNNTFTDD